MTARRKLCGRYGRAWGNAQTLKELHPSVAAEVLLCAGILTGWVGSRNEIKEAQEVAKNLITESITYYEVRR